MLILFGEFYDILTLLLLHQVLLATLVLLRYYNIEYHYFGSTTLVIPK